MADPVPVGRKLRLAKVVGLLGGHVTGLPEVMNLEQAGQDGENLSARSVRNQVREPLLGKCPTQSRPGRLLLNERWTEALRSAQGRNGQRGQDVERGDRQRS